MSKTWKLAKPIPAQTAESLGVFPPLARQLLYNRNVTSSEEAEIFLHPNYPDLLDAFLFVDMEKAVERIWRAIQGGEKICVYGDYDADAVTANAVLQLTFRRLGVAAESYIPDRFTEGYGVNMDAIKKIRDSGCTVIITVDCGTNSVDAAEFCSQHGIDLIITDHHEIIGALPKAYALINPKNPNDTFPYHDLVGVGVAFKLATAILKNPKSEIRNPKAGIGYEKWLLDLVAIGTVADCHELVGENRILVYYGLKVLQKSRWVGLQALCAEAGLDFSEKLPDTYTLGFVIAPRLNAAGRLEHANIALQLLLEADAVAAQQKAVRLNEINRRRQDLTEQVLSEAREQALMFEDRKVLVLMGEGWPKGVVGLAAGKLAEEFNRPTIVLSREGEEATGSARTVGDFDVVESLKYASEFLTKFGGHTQAAGLTLKAPQYENFYQKVLEFADMHMRDEASAPVLTLEAELLPTDLKLETINVVRLFEPFGVGNPKPIFLINGCSVESLRMVGSTQNHMQLGLGISGVHMAAIAFNSTHLAKSLSVGDTIDVAAELLEDSWNGNRKLKLRIIDVHTDPLVTRINGLDTDLLISTDSQVLSSSI